MAMAAAQDFERTHEAADSGLTVAVTDSFADLRDTYERLAERSGTPAPQSAQWIATYARCHGGHFAYVTIGDGNQPRMILALERIRRGGAVTLQFAGGRHANGNFPAFDPDWIPDTGALLRTVTTALKDTCPDVDAVVLERQLAHHDGLANPFVTSSSTPSPNVALAADLSEGFDGLLATISEKRKRKKNRSQTRKFEAAGGFALARAQSAAEVDRALDAFFAMKDVRFRQAGIDNVFALPGVRDFLRALFKAELGRERPRFVIDTLEVGGTLRAVAAASVSGQRMTCEFASFADDELAQASPGEFLFFNAIKAAAEDGFQLYDFGVGDEYYKRLWCRLETVHHDTVIALTPKGFAYRALWTMTGWAKGRVKNSTMLWPMVKRLRLGLRGSRGSDAAQDQAA